MSDDHGAEAARKAEIAERLKLKDAEIARITAHRVFVKHPGETTETSMCPGCGGTHVRRGYCTGCGAKA